MKNEGGEEKKHVSLIAYQIHKAQRASEHEKGNKLSPNEWKTTHKIDNETHSKREDIPNIPIEVELWDPALSPLLIDS